MTALLPVLGAILIGGLPFALLLIIRSRQPAPWAIDDDAAALMSPPIDIDPIQAEDESPYTQLFRRAVSLQPLLPRQNPDAVLRT